MQRRQPTFKAMRAFLQSRRAADMSAPTLAQARDAFPGASAFMVRRMFEDISVSVSLEEWFDDMMAEDMSEICYEPDDIQLEAMRREKLSTDLTMRSRQLWAENFQADLMDLTHAYSMLDRTSKRRPQPIMEQSLLKSTARGYEVAVRRGDVCLVLQYLEELQRWSKQRGCLGHGDRAALPNGFIYTSLFP